MSCLTDENDPGELKQCSLLNGLCAKGTMDFEGKTVTVRRCQQAKGKSGLCEDVHILEAKTRMCYCDTDVAMVRITFILHI